MGNRYEVWVWEDVPLLGGWRYTQTWGGESLVVCLWKGLRAKQSYGAVKLVLR
jgi:hypothetical protein